MTDFFERIDISKNDHIVLSIQVVHCFIKHQMTLPTSRASLFLQIRKLADLQLPNIQSTLRKTNNYSFKNIYNDTNKSILILLAKRIDRMSNLRYLTLMNPHISKIYNAYLESFQDVLILNHKKVEDEVEFSNVLKRLLELHLDNIIDLRDGIFETNGVVDETGVFDGMSENEFLNEHLRERILLRLLSNNFISVKENGISLVDLNLDVIDVVHRSIDFVNGMAAVKYGDDKVNINIKTFVIDKNGTYETDPKEKHIFPYISNHIEYVLQEILKNATRALLENKIFKDIEMLIILNKSDLNNQTLQIKISDLGGGIEPEVTEKLWNYSFTTVNENKKDIEIDLSGLNADQNIIAGMGYGLPLSSTYCKLFGGDIKLHTVWGRGTDVNILFKSL